MHTPYVSEYGHLARVVESYNYVPLEILPTYQPSKTVS